MSNRRWCCAPPNPIRACRWVRRRRRLPKPRNSSLRGAAKAVAPVQAATRLPTITAAEGLDPGLSRADNFELLEGDGDDLVGFVAARGRDLDAVALGLADKGPRQRRGHREPPILDVGFVLADDAEG